MNTVMFNREDFLTCDLIEHCDHVESISSKIAEHLNISDTYKMYLKEASLLHDIGKHYIHTEILNANRPLLPIERSVVDMHSYWGYLKLCEQKVTPIVCQLVLAHHGLELRGCILNKHLDGLDELYPILMASDIYSAMTSDRAYRKALPHEEAIHTLREKHEIPLELVSLVDSLFGESY